MRLSFLRPSLFLRPLLFAAAVPTLGVVVAGCASRTRLSGDASPGRSTPNGSVDPAHVGDGDDRVSVPISSADPTWGAPSAPITLVESADFQCPFSARVEPTLERLKTAYGPNQLRIVWKNSPLPSHPSARPASEAAAGVFAVAGADAFWRFHDLAFKNQSELAMASYELWAREAGVADVAAWKAQLVAHAWGPKIDEDLATMTQLNAHGTPSFFINGHRFTGAQPFEAFKVVFDRELGKAASREVSGSRGEAPSATP